MKALKTVGYTVVIAILVVGFAFVARNESVKKTMLSFNAEKENYRAHHQPTPDWYYTVESDSTSGDKTFIIGRNMQPVLKTVVKGSEVLISLQPNGKLQEIEVPTKKIGLKAVGTFFTVKTIDGVPTLIYFTSEQDVIQSMIKSRNTPSPGGV